jgi:hypothetical protein
MPNFDKRSGVGDELEIASRIVETVQRQIGTYRLALEKVRLLRKEFALDESLAKTAMSSPEKMSQLLVERRIPEGLANGMAAEDFQNPDFARNIGLWTWDCCCTGCCITDCHCTLVTSIGSQPGGGVRPIE